MTANNIIQKAISYIGVKESPQGSNNVIFNTDYYGSAVNGNNYAWCCTFIWDIFRMCNASKLFYNGEKTAYCPTVESWGRKNNLIIDKDKAQYGDIVLFDFDKSGTSGHIGLIESRNIDGTYSTIEGNTSISNNDNGGSVMRRNRSQSLIRCIIRPKYEEMLKYRTHQQSYGWSNWVNDGEISGVTGQAKRLEAIQIDPKDKEIYAQAHIQGLGWVDFGKVTKDTIIGTVGQGKRLEAIELKGAKVMTHIQTIGWATEYSNNQGTIGLGKRIEAIRIKL